MRRTDVRLERVSNDWQVSILSGPETGRNRNHLALGRCRHQLPALRLWLALVTGGRR